MKKEKLTKEKRIRIQEGKLSEPLIQISPKEFITTSNGIAYEITKDSCKELNVWCSYEKNETYYFLYRKKYKKNKAGEFIKSNENKWKNINDRQYYKINTLRDKILNKFIPNFIPYETKKNNNDIDIYIKVYFENIKQNLKNIIYLIDLGETNLDNLKIPLAGRHNDLFQLPKTGFNLLPKIHLGKVIEHILGRTSVSLESHKYFVLGLIYDEKSCQEYLYLKNKFIYTNAEFNKNIATFQNNGELSGEKYVEQLEKYHDNATLTQEEKILLINYINDNKPDIKLNELFDLIFDNIEDLKYRINEH